MTKPSSLAFALGVALLVSVVGFVGAGCSSSSSTPPLTSSAGEVIGPNDSHCALPDGGEMIQTIGLCYTTTDQLPSTASNGMCGGITFDTKDTFDAGSADNVDASVDATPTSDYGPTMYGSAGNDDDCKYYVSWVSTPIQENVDVYFTVTAIRLSDMKPAECAGIRPDVSQTLTNGAAPPANPAPEIAPGVYKVGPIKFDAAGNTPGNYWTVRFHLYEECDDDPADSPHGHAAFYVSVP